MSEREATAYKVRGARAEYDANLGQYHVIPQDCNSGATIERDKDGDFFFKTYEEAMSFCLLQMLYHAVIEPVYED